MTELYLLDLDIESLALIETDLDAYCVKHAVIPGKNAKLICDMAAFWNAFRIKVQALPPWIGYLAIDSTTKMVVGTCAFKGNPDRKQTVEIAYFTFPDHEGTGCATAMARGLIRIALAQPVVPTIIAHTLPQRNASTRVLQKVGMKFAGDVIDPEDGPVWRWQFEQSPHF